jgi:tetratricopeptide (TPR) repeat protein
MLGEAYRKMGEFSDAISAYNQLLKLNPMDADAYVRLAECNMQLDLMDAAREALSKALAINPNNREAQYLKKHLGEMTTPHKPGF